MEIFGVTLKLDFFDADDLEKYERENQKVADRIKDPAQYQGKSTADAIRLQCRIVDDFFDSLFGPGTAQKIFKGKANIREHMEAFGIVAKSAMDSRADFDAMADKYTPNRAERRQAERNGRNGGGKNRHDFHAVHGSGKGSR